MAVNLTRIYTKLGDEGETHLGDRSRVPKTHPRVVAYGCIDELNSQIGLALSTTAPPERIADILSTIQNQLFDVGADISMPPTAGRSPLRISDRYVEWLEAICDEFNAELESLRSFVIPGGSHVGAYLHVCRTICRRSEILLLEVEDANPLALKYLNRLSDCLFILARTANRDFEPLWEPGSIS